MNKSIKIGIGILITIIILWGVIFCIDYNRVSNYKIPIFVIQKGDNYYGLGYEVKIEVQKFEESVDGIMLKMEMYMFNKMIIGAVADHNENDALINSEQK